MKTPTSGGTGASILGPTWISMHLSSSTTAPSSRRLLLPRPERSVPGTLPRLVLGPRGWGHILKLNGSQQGREKARYLSQEEWSYKFYQTLSNSIYEVSHLPPHSSLVRLPDGSRFPTHPSPLSLTLLLPNTIFSSV